MLGLMNRIQPRLAYHTLKRVGLAKCVFTLRVNPPSTTLATAKWVDLTCGACLLRSLCPSQPRPSNLTMALLSLPLSLGGLGVCRAETMRAALSERCQMSSKDEREYHTTVDPLPLCEKAAILSGAHRAATRLWSDPTVPVDDACFRIATLLRAHAPVYSASTLCRCGLQASNAHILSCGHLRGGGRIVRHDAIVRAIAVHCTAQGMTVVVEPRGTSLTSRTRPDLFIQTPLLSCMVDVTVATPGAALTGWEHQGGAAARAAKAKHKHWDPLVSKGITFFPFAMESTGLIDTEGLQLLTQLCGDHPSDIVTHLNSLEKKICAALHRGNFYLVSSVRWGDNVMANTSRSHVALPLTSA